MKLRTVLLSLVLGSSLAVACDKDKKEETNAPAGDQADAGEGEGEDDEGGNLCKLYKTCDECIAGQQAKGVSEGAAETECGAAVMGCWTTWDKPIVCNGKEHSKDGEGGDEGGGA
jgi:hypothetical protein